MQSERLTQYRWYWLDAVQLLSIGFAAVALVPAGIVFWSFTYPMNVLTANWTVAPADFEAARDQWEYSHAAASLLSVGHC